MQFEKMEKSTTLTCTFFALENTFPQKYLIYVGMARL